MEFLNALNIEQLGTTGGIIAYLIWKNTKLEEAIIKANDRAFDTLRQSAADAIENSRTLDKVLSALGGNNV